MKFAMKSLGFLFIALVTALASNAYGQSTKAKDAFPTYQQIKHPTGEIIDYVTPQGSSVSQEVSFNLFNYREGEVTYVINGKSTTDVQAVKKLVNREGVHIENISIREPTKDAKKTIEIHYIIK